VIGPGRLGLSVARALVARGATVAVLGRQAQALPEPLEPASPVWEPIVGASDLVVIAVPDDAIDDVALRLARTHSVNTHHAVLHTSGLHDRSSLAALQGSGAALGSWHPLQTFTTTTGDPDLLAGAPAIIEGDARALAAARALSERLAMAPVLELAADRKASYHAAAVFASNYLVVLADIAERLARDADRDWPDGTFLPLMRQTVANLAAGPAAALTGPVRRGDARTVERHLQALEGRERIIYLGLARETLRLAREAGLDSLAADAVGRVLY
jgi:predicted short-subunit dehydrogenase-like oxidoreductase (DUF2520 family)